MAVAGRGGGEWSVALQECTCSGARQAVGGVRDQGSRLCAGRRAAATAEELVLAVGKGPDVRRMRRQVVPAAGHITYHTTDPTTLLAGRLWACS